jgi:sterol desaturase/sphingolipid hydroxylase (fatty acid hydroxylase superfamily)
MLIVLTFFLGLISWSFGEYALHNWYGHVPRGKNNFSRTHLDHHADQSWFAPTALKIKVGVAVFLLVTPIAMLIAGWDFGLAWGLGLTSAYTAYEVLHRRVHTHPPIGPYSRWVRRHHLSHHFHNPNHNHGVTSPIWDIVFRTYRKVGVIRVPEKQVMVWLANPETGEVWEKYASDYVIARRKARMASASAFGCSR